MKEQVTVANIATRIVQSYKGFPETNVILDSIFTEIYRELSTLKNLNPYEIQINLKTGLAIISSTTSNENNYEKVYLYE